MSLLITYFWVVFWEVYMPVPAEAVETYSAYVWGPLPQQDYWTLQDVCLCLECQ